MTDQSLYYKEGFDMKLEGRTILVTGGSSGIGLEMATQLLAKGNTVIVTGRNQEALDAAKRRLPALHTVRSDVADIASIDALYETVTHRFPQLDSVINNAGIMRTVRLDEGRPLDDVTREIDVNVSGVIRTVQRFMPHLLRQPTGLIVNVSSGLAFVPLPLSPIYSAAKAAVHAYTRCLRVQLGETTIKVVELAPPLTETPLYSDEFKTKLGGAKGMPVDALIRTAINGIEAGRNEICPGQSRILQIAARIAPGAIFRQMSKVR